MINPEEYNERLKASLTQVPLGFKPSNVWYQNAKLAMFLSCPMQMQISGAEMKELYNKLQNKDNLNYYEFAIANNNLDAKSARDLNYSDMNGYLDFIEEVAGYAAKWNEYAKDIQEAMMAELTERAKKEAAGAKLKSMVGEA